MAILVAGCTVGPDFKRPPEPEAKSYTREGDSKVASASDGVAAQEVVVGKKITTSWWKLFHSAPLNEMLEQALAHNRTLAAARATLGQARETVRQAGGALYPHVSMGANVSRQRASLASEGITTVPAEFNLYSVGPTVSFDLDLFGANRRRVEQQTALAEAQEYQLGAAYLALTGNVVTQAIAIAGIREQIEAVEAIIADDERNLATVRTETRAGELTRIDIDSAESQLAADRTLLPPLQQELSVATDALAVLLGRAPSEWTPPELDLESLVLPSELPLAVPSALVRARPDILTAEAQLHAASAAIGVATAQLYPNINLTGNLAQEALSPSRLFLPMSNIWSIVSGLTAPIFEGGALEAQKRGTEKSFDAALANYEQTVLQSFAQVADVLHALDHDAALLREQRRALAAASSSLTHVRQTFAFGNVTLLQMLDAERQYARARQGVVSAQAQRRRDTVQLFLAMGGDWQEWRAATARTNSAQGDDGGHATAPRADASATGR